MYSKNELLKFSIYNTYEEIINPNLIYKVFEKSLIYNKNLFKISKDEIIEFLENECSFNLAQIEKILRLFEICLDNEILRIYSDCKKNNINLLFYNYENYPSSLMKIKKAPYVLYYKGNINLENMNTVALVGTRNISEAGKKFTEKIGKFLKDKNFFNISGLALGVDTIGHINTLGQTGAVLAQGLLTEIYPKENKKLAENILETGGFLLSELPPYSNISVNNFIKRNRIQAGLAENIIIAESDVKGGTVHTFKYAKQQNKKIFIADFNKNFIEKHKKDIIIIIKNSLDFEKKLKSGLEQKNLF